MYKPNLLHTISSCQVLSVQNGTVADGACVNADEGLTAAADILLCYAAGVDRLLDSSNSKAKTPCTPSAAMISLPC